MKKQGNKIKDEWKIEKTKREAKEKEHGAWLTEKDQLHDKIHPLEVELQQCKDMPRENEP